MILDGYGANAQDLPKAAADYLDVNLGDLQDISDAVLGAGQARA